MLQDQLVSSMYANPYIHTLRLLLKTSTLLQVMDRATANGYDYDDPGCQSTKISYLQLHRELAIDTFLTIFRGKLRSRRTRSRTFTWSIRAT